MKRISITVALAASFALPTLAQVQGGLRQEGTRPRSDRRLETQAVGVRRSTPAPGTTTRAEGTRRAPSVEVPGTNVPGKVAPKQETPREGTRPNGAEGTRHALQEARLAAMRNELEALGKTLRQHDAQRAEYVARIEALRTELRSIEEQRAKRREAPRGREERKEAPSAGKERPAAPRPERAREREGERRPETPRKEERRGSDARPRD
jgi:hypothetical protein